MSLKTFISSEQYDEPTVAIDGPVEENDSVEITQAPEAIEAVTSQDAILEQIEDTEEAIVTVEAYCGILKRCAKTGISAESAAFMQVGLERFEHLFDNDLKQVPSLEAFGGTASRQMSTQVSLEALKDQAQSLLAKLKALFKMLMDAAKEVYRRVAEDAERLVEKLQALQTKARNLANDEPQKDKVSIRNAGSLSVGSEFMGKDSTAIAGVVAYLANIYPSQLSTYITEIAGVMRRTARDGASKEEVYSMLNSLRSPESLFKGNADTLPGNVKLVFETPEGENIKKFLGQRIKLEKVEGADAGAIEIDVSAPADLVRRINALVKTTQVLARIKEISAGPVSNSGKVLEAADELAKNLEAEKYEGDKAEGPAELVKEASGIPKMAGPAMTDAISYCYKTLAAYAAVINHELNAYG